MAQGRPERSRTAQPPPSGPSHSTSSSSISSSRGDRVTRSNNNRQQSSNKSSTPHSLSSEDAADDPSLQQSEPPLTRRRTRQQDNEDNGTAKIEGDAEDDVVEEEEITRCLCGHQEYQGLPPDAAKLRDSQSYGVNASEISNEDAGVTYIQCDDCQVWQHGACVGIMDEASSPDEYFCESCRPHFHKIFKSSTGQKCSSYLPIQKKPLPKIIHRKASISKDIEEKPGRDRDRSSAAAAEALKKRRSTMNSRAAVDDEEVLREVIEESRTDATGTTGEGDGSVRKAKRARDDSEEVKPGTKRPRTGSRSPISSPTLESEDDAASSKNAAKAKPRGVAAKSQREKELRDREREREKAEAANKRKGRAERRRAEDSETVEDVPTTAEDDTKAPEAVEVQAPDTLQIGVQAAPVKKSGRPPQKRSQRSGRNQYTRDNPTPTNAASPHDDQSPSSPSARNAGQDANNDAQALKQQKLRNAKLDKVTWTNARREATAMLNYITRRQVELAEKSSGTPANTSNPASKTNGITEIKATSELTIAHDGHPSINDDEFKKLNTVEMMDKLTREIHLWQQRTKEF